MTELWEGSADSRLALTFLILLSPLLTVAGLLRRPADTPIISHTCSSVGFNSVNISRSIVSLSITSSEPLCTALVALRTRFTTGSQLLDVRSNSRRPSVSSNIHYSTTDATLNERTIASTPAWLPACLCPCVITETSCSTPPVKMIFYC